jgi:AAA15 family ATPase/GTPase
LHPLIGRFLVRLINKPAATYRRVQVLLVSHTAALMDLNILRRYEVWLMKVNCEYASQSTSFVTQKARKHEFIAEAYLDGQYDAVPRIDMAKVNGVAVTIAANSTRSDS